MQEIWQKLKTGLKDYLTASGFGEVVLGLSGGLDSALVAVLAADVLGGAKVRAVMMRTRYTSELSLQIARRIAALNGLNYQELEIEPQVERGAAFLEAAWQEKAKPIVLENLQARIRGQILMAYANQYNRLLLACGNKSEIMTGYCTLYGDTCGGLAPIGGLYKSKIFELARWRNTVSPALPEEVIARAPSAELSDGQKDEDTLPPYAVLDQILTLLVDDGLSENEIIGRGYDARTVAKVILLNRRSAFKQLQLPPALAV